MSIPPKLPDAHPFEPLQPMLIARNVSFVIVFWKGLELLAEQLVKPAWNLFPEMSVEMRTQFPGEVCGLIHALGTATLCSSRYDNKVKQICIKSN